MSGLVGNNSRPALTSWARASPLGQRQAVMSMMGLIEVTVVMVMSAGPWTLTRHHPRKEATLGGWRAWLVRAVAPRKGPSQMYARQLPFV